MPPTFRIIIETDTEGWYVAHVPEIPGCHTQGATLEELLERIPEAVLVSLDD